MDKLDWKIRRFLVDEGYLFPQTDAEIERAIKECEMKHNKSLDTLRFSSALRKKRYVDLRIDIRTASEQIGISYPTLSRIESGKTPDLITYARCCSWLGVDMDLFFNPA